MSYTVPSFWSSPPSSDTEWLRAMLDRSQAYDRIAAMRRQELSDAYRCADYFSTASYQPPLQTPSSPSHRQRRRSSDNGGGSKQGGQGKPVDAECRRKMWEWCTQIVDFCKFSRETVSVAMSFLDRYLSAGVTAGDVHAARARASRKEYQLAAMTALYIAVKLNEPLEMETSLVSDLSRGCYTAREVAHMERRMLDALTWRTSDPTPMHFLRHYLALLPRRCTESDAAATELLDLGRHQIEYAESEYAFVTVNSSTIAAAALINALEVMSDEDENSGFYPLLTHNDKISLLRNVMDASLVDVTSEEIRHVRGALAKSFYTGASLRQGEAVRAGQGQEERVNEGGGGVETMETEIAEPELMCEDDEERQKHKAQGRNEGDNYGLAGHCDGGEKGSRKARRSQAKVNSPVCVVTGR